LVALPPPQEADRHHDRKVGRLALDPEPLHQSKHEGRWAPKVGKLWSRIQSPLAVSFRPPPKRLRKGDREVVYYYYYSGVDTKDEVLRVYDYDYDSNYDDTYTYSYSFNDYYDTR